MELRRARPREELRVSPEVMTVWRGRHAVQATVGKPRGQLGRARLKPATGELLQVPGEAAPRRRSEWDARGVESGSGPGRDGWARRRSAQEERGATRVNFGRGGPDVGWSTPALLLAAPRAGAPGGSWPGGLGLGLLERCNMDTSCSPSPMGPRLLLPLGSRPRRERSAVLDGLELGSRPVSSGQWPGAQHPEGVGGR